jgi:hypothetical protein
MADTQVLVGLAIVSAVALAAYAYHMGWFGKKEGLCGDAPPGTLGNPTERDLIRIRNQALAGNGRGGYGQRDFLATKGALEQHINSGANVSISEMQRRHNLDLLAQGMRGNSEKMHGGGGGGKLAAGFPGPYNRNGEPLRPEEVLQAEQGAWGAARDQEVDHFDPSELASTAAAIATGADKGYSEFIQNLVVNPLLHFRHMQFVKSAKPFGAMPLIVDTLEMANYIPRVGLHAFNVQGVDQVNPMQLTEIDADDTSVNPTEVRVL